MNYIFRVLLLLGFALLPLSSRGKDQNWEVLFAVNIPFVSGVYSPGLILLWTAAVVGVFLKILEGQARFAGRATPLLCGLVYVSTMFALLPWSLDLNASLIRVSSHLLGFLIFLLLVISGGFRKANPDLLSGRDLGSTGLAVFGVSLSLYYISNSIYQVGLSGLEELVFSRYMGGVNSLAWGASNVVASVLLISLGSLIASSHYFREKSVFTVTLFVISIGILSTLSRNSIACWIMLMAVYALQRDQGGRLWGLVLVGMFSLIYMFLVSNSLVESIVDSRTADIGEVRTLGGRNEIWLFYLSKLYYHPLGFNGLYSTLLEFGFSPHNWIITTYWELGIVGVTCGLILYLSPLRTLFGNQHFDLFSVNRRGWQLIAAALIIFINVQTEDPGFSHQYIVCWWVWAAFILNERERLRTASLSFLRSPK